MEQEIKTLIADNQKLSQQVGILLNEKLQNAQQENNHDKEFEDLKKQVTLLTKVFCNCFYLFFFLSDLNIASQKDAYYPH